MTNYINANDKFSDYNGTDNFYRHFTKMLYTDGVKALCDDFQCYWFLDIVASYQSQLKGEEFQVWLLRKEEDGSAVVTCTDGNDRELVSQSIPSTGFAAQRAIIWVEYCVALLPSER
ncbi:MAG: hypothetical protein EOP48_16195 [Sphingobacteriales bacterium]|nr:MAG: hypothetical protein EOP48_16195 [Sphingobacteriales bacterium]